MQVPIEVIRAGLAISQFRAVLQLFVDLTLSDGSYARIHLEGMVDVCETFGVPAKQAHDWLQALQRRSECGTFYYALPWTYLVARVT